MHLIKIILMGLIFVQILSCSKADKDEYSYSVATGRQNGSDVIYRFISDDINNSVKLRFGWLTVIIWKYDKTENGGMPSKSLLPDMNAFEDAVYSMINERDLGINVYVKTGSGKREYAYYIQDRESFTKYLNEALSGHKVYPIEIVFYEDKKWSDFEKMRSSVKSG